MIVLISAIVCGYEENWKKIDKGIITSHKENTGKKK